MRVFPEGWVDGRGGGVGVCRLSRIMRVLVLLVLAITFVSDFCMCFESAYIHTQGYRGPTVDPVGHPQQNTGRRLPGVKE